MQQCLAAYHLRNSSESLQAGRPGRAGDDSDVVLGPVAVRGVGAPLSARHGDFGVLVSPRNATVISDIVERICLGQRVLLVRAMYPF